MIVNRFLLDSNIFILLFNDRLSENLPEGEIACSIITEMELLSFPRLSAQEEKMIRNCLSTIAVYNINDAIKEETIRLRRTYRLKLPDAIIVATARIHAAVLLTNDEQLHGIAELSCRKLVVKP